MNLLKAFFLSLISAGCTPKPAPVAGGAVISEAYISAVDRLESRFVENGFVVSRNPDGTPAHQGDSLLWSGVALGLLPCDRGEAIEIALQSMLVRQNGRVNRYPGDDTASADGLIGLWFGASRRIICPGKLDSWANPLRLHSDYYENGQAPVPPGFWVIPKAFTGRTVSDPEAALLRIGVAAWAKATVDNHAACYRVHLGYLVLQTLEALGKSGPIAGFCGAAKGGQIPLISTYCGDMSSLQKFIDTFEYDRWEYAFQRCPDWETPDGNGLETPALDLIYALRGI